MRERAATDPWADPLRRLEIRGWPLGRRRLSRRVRVAFADFAPPSAGAGDGGVDATARGGAHLVIGGMCWLERDGDPPRVRLADGDVIMLAHERPHVLRVGSATTRSDVVSVGFTFVGPVSERVRATLPAVLHLSGRRRRGPSWLAPLRDVLASESARRTPGAVAALERAIELLVVQMVRAHWDAVVGASAPPPGLSLGASVAAVLRLMEAEPSRAWTVAALAREACSSRSVFAARFTAEVGMPPLRYLRECRMRAAEHLLADEALGLKAIADAVGYRSRAAFSKAYRTWAGHPPGQGRHAAVPDEPARG